MPTTVISDSVTATSGFNITNSDDHFFTVTSFREATGTNDEAIFTSNGDTVRSVVTLAGTAIGNRVGVELDGSDILVVTQTGTVLSERAATLEPASRAHLASAWLALGQEHVTWAAAGHACRAMWARALTQRTCGGSGAGACCW